MENTYEYRQFLIINHLANRMIGMTYLNFAKLIVEETNGRYMNSQMTNYFYHLDEVISELLCDETLIFFDALDEEELAEIEPEQLEKDFYEYCNGNIRFNYVTED
jgi:hypothetical protein